MGNKTSSKDKSSGGSLHPDEQKRLTTFLDQKREKGAEKFTYSGVQKLWSDILVPDLLSSYGDFLFKSGEAQRSNISIEDFISIYVKIVRGESDEKANAVAAIIGSKRNQEGVDIISYQSLCKYFSDLFESYFCGLEHRNNNSFKSWTQIDPPQRTAIEEVVKGICNDLQRTDDEVRLDLFENWLNMNGLANLLHSYVLGSMYNLQPEHDSHVIPLAKFPETNQQKFPILLDLSHVVYLNSFLPAANREEWRLLFSTFAHGESFSKFVASIVNQGPILIVVCSSNENMFGGFISTNVNLSPKWIGSDDSFLFRLGAPVDVYPSTGYNDHYAYLNSHQTTLPNGLGMGGQFGYWGLWIDGDKFGVGECSESCTTYKNYTSLDNHIKYQIKSLEVWAVGDPPPTDEERGERTTTRARKSALDQDPATTQLLEMAGHEMHSKGIRDSTGMKKKS